MNARQVGRVAALWRYPVKSMAAQSLDEIDVSWEGFAGDRRWAFVRGDQVRNGFPWLTIRERNDMWLYQPSFVDPANPESSAVVVRTPAGVEYDVADEALAVELGAGVRVIKSERGLFDAMPLSLISAQTLATLGAQLEVALPALRFRPSLVIDAPGEGDFPEDGWVGRTLTVGGLRLRVDQRDKRCVMVNVDPATAQRTPAVLSVIARERQVCLGVYGSTVAPGRVAVGDAVFLDDEVSLDG